MSDQWDARKEATEDIKWRNQYGVGWTVPKGLPDLLYPPNATEKEYTKHQRY